MQPQAGSPDAPASDLYPSKQALAAAFAVAQRAKMPSIPDVVSKVRHELAGVDPDFGRVAALIAQDPALAGGVLRAVNSAALAGSEPIDDLHHALVRLGLAETGRLVTAESLRVIGEEGGQAVMDVWESIVEESRVATWIARHTGAVEPTEAYLFGMMHDVAHLLFARIDPRASQLRDLSASNPISILERERHRLTSDHAAVGFLFARHWGLPEYFALAILHHHAPRCGHLDDPRSRALVAVIKLANYLTMRHLADLESPEMIQMRVAAMRELMVSAETWEEICHDVASGSD